MNSTITTNASSMKEKIYKIRCFLPLISSVAFAIGLLFGHVKVIELLMIPLFFLGFASALTVCPLKLLFFPFRCVAVGFKICRGFIPVYGVADLCAALFGTCLGLGFGICTIVVAPGIFSVKKYLENR